MNQNIGVLVPLADRIRWTNAARIVVALLPPLAWLSRPDLRLGGLAPLLVGAGLVLGLSLAMQPLVRLGRRQALWTIGAALMADGVYLAAAFLMLGDFAGPVGYVLMLHAIAVTLLTSFRTGLKVVLWHSIVLLVAIEAEMSGLVEGPLTGEPFSTHEFAGLLGMLWIAALGTATFAAANERELRRRRYDAEVLRRMAMRLEQDSEVDDVASTLATVAHDELDATRSAVVVFTEYVATETHTIETFVPGTASTVRVLAPRPGRAPCSRRHRVPRRTTSQMPARPSLDDAMSRAVAEHRPLLVPELDPSVDPWLAMALPGAQNLLIVPSCSTSRRSVSSRWSTPTRGAASSFGTRRVSLAGGSDREQAVAHAAQAFGRAALVSRLRASVDTDGLTGIANRRSFDSPCRASSPARPGPVLTPPCCWSTSTTSRRSTTPTATRSATTCCAPSVPSCTTSAAPATSLHATAARSSA